MIVKDEERFLEDALRSVAGTVDEICIVDTGSTDRTLEIARAHGARILQRTWDDDFSAARNASLALATRRWIVVLDADERLAPESKAALAGIGATPVGRRGHWITCRNLTDTYAGSGPMSNALVRIFPNDARIRYRNAIHEFVALGGSEAGLAADSSSIEIVHHGYLSDVVSERRKAERNLRLSRRAVEAAPADAFAHYNLGMAALLGGDRETALTALDCMRELTHDTPRGYRVHGLVVLAELYADLRADSATARALLDGCLALVPNYSNAHFALGTLLARTGELYEARNAFGRAISAGAFDREQFVVDNEIAIWKAPSEIGATLMREGRYGQALAWFELAGRERPGVTALTINAAKCHEALGDRVTAECLYRSAFEARADERSAIEWINFLFRADRPEAALAAIDRGLAFVGAQTRPVVLGSAAAVHLRAGRQAQAQRCVDRAVAGAERATAVAAIEALGRHLRMPELAALLPIPPRGAGGLRIAYVT